MRGASAPIREFIPRPRLLSESAATSANAISQSAQIVDRTHSSQE
jgi:hypothetical protein